MPSSSALESTVANRHVRVRRQPLNGERLGARGQRDAVEREVEVVALLKGVKAVAVVALSVVGDRAVLERQRHVRGIDMHSLVCRSRIGEAGQIDGDVDLRLHKSHLPLAANVRKQLDRRRFIAFHRIDGPLNGRVLLVTDPGDVAVRRPRSARSKARGGHERNGEGGDKPAPRSSRPHVSLVSLCRLAA